MHRNTHLVYIVLVNIFICQVIINSTLYGYDIPYFYAILPPEVYEYDNISNMIGDVSGMALIFMVIGCILITPLMIIKYKKRKTSKFLINKKYKFIIVVIMTYILFFTEFISNATSLIASNGYFIPKESSIFTFSVTLENPGNGEYWIYGEDEKYCYYSGVTPYISIKKKNMCPEFDKLDYRTWCGIDIHKYDE